MRILLSRIGALGDTLGAYSVVPILKKHFGDGIRFDWIVRKGVESLFEQDPNVDRVYSVRSRNHVYQLLFRAAHRFKHYDLILNLDTNGYPVLLNLISAQRKLGLPFQDISLPQRIHLYDLHQMICRKALGISEPGVDVLPRLYGVTLANRTLKEPYLVVAAAIGSSHPRAHRIWPLTQWEQFLRLALSNLPFRIVMVGTRNDEQSIAERINITSKIVNYMGKTTLPELITLVRNASAVVTCDTGILHLASATQTPLFALLGPSDPLRHGPFPVDNPIHHVIRSGLACSPCERTPTYDACKSNRCMQLITPQRVVDSIMSWATRSGLID